MKYENTGKIIRDAREALNISQADLAGKLGLENAQSISNIERGLTGVPRKYVFEMCKVLKIDTHELIDAMLEDMRNKYLR